MPPISTLPENDENNQPTLPNQAEMAPATIVVNGVTQTLTSSPIADIQTEKQKIVDLVPGLRLLAYSFVALPLAGFLLVGILIAINPMAAWLLIGAVPAVIGLIINIVVCIYLLKATNHSAVTTILLVYMAFDILGCFGPGIIISGPLAYWTYTIWRQVNRLTKA